MAKLTGYNVPADTTVTFFSILRDRERETLVTKDWRHTRLRVRFAKFLTRSRKGKVEIAARERRLGGQKCCVAISDEITGRQIRGPLSGEFITEMRVQKCTLSAMRVSTNLCRRCIDREERGAGAAH